MFICSEVREETIKKVVLRKLGSGVLFISEHKLTVKYHTV